MSNAKTSIFSDTKWLYGMGCATTFFALASTLAGLPMFRFGVWYQSEPIFFVILIAGVFMAGILMLLVRAGEPIGLPMRHPAMQLFTFFVLWSVLSSMLAGIPMRSFFGAPETAEGVLWYTTIWISIMLIFAILRDGRFARTLFWGQWGILLITVIAQTGVSDTLKVFKWGDYLGIISMLYVVSMVYAFRLFPDIRHRMVLLIPAPLALFVSDNQSAMLIGVLFTAAGAAWWALRRFEFVTKYGKFIALIALLPPLVIAVAPLSERLSCGLVDTVQLAYPHYPSCDANDSKVFNNSTIGSRILFYGMAFDAISDHPEFLVTGAGYGTYADLFYRYSYTGNVRNYTDDTYDPNWIFGQGHVFHPHHSWIYILISTGLPGFICWLGAFIALFYFLRGTELIVLASGWLAALMLLAVWFAVPMVSPFMGLAMACSMPLNNSRKTIIKWSSVRPKIKQSALGCALAACLVSSWIVLDVGRRSEEKLLEIVNGTESVAYTALPDYGRGFMHQWWIALSYSDYLTAKRKQQAPYTENDVIWATVMLRIMEDAIRSPQHSTRIDGHYAAFINDIMLYYSPASSLWVPVVNQYAEDWRSIIRDYMIKIPTRSDVATSFFEFWLDRYIQLEGQAKQVARNNIVYPLEAVLAVHPNHPVAKWYYGRLLAIEPNTKAQGLQFMREGLEGGAGKFVPVTKDIRALLENAQ